MRYFRSSRQVLVLPSFKRQKKKLIFYSKVQLLMPVLLLSYFQAHFYFTTDRYFDHQIPQKELDRVHHLTIIHLMIDQNSPYPILCPKVMNFLSSCNFKQQVFKDLHLMYQMEKL